MSKWIKECDNGKNEVSLDNPDKCDWMYNEVCCNDKSDYVADYPNEYDCKNCKLFKKETFKGHKSKIVSIFD